MKHWFVIRHLHRHNIDNILLQRMYLQTLIPVKRPGWTCKGLLIQAFFIFLMTMVGNLADGEYKFQTTGLVLSISVFQLDFQLSLPQLRDLGQTTSTYTFLHCKTLHYWWTVAHSARNFSAKQCFIDMNLIPVHHCSVRVQVADKGCLGHRGHFPQLLAWFLLFPSFLFSSKRF